MFLTLLSYRANSVLSHLCTSPGNFLNAGNVAVKVTDHFCGYLMRQCDSGKFTLIQS